YVCNCIDHIIRLADILKLNEPLTLLHGHKKAVSYVQFLNEKELVSASTDSELKLWSIDTGSCLRTFKGHVNDKNFVGLSVNNGYITCGSENNSFYVYQKYVSKPILSFKFQLSRNILPSVNEHRSDKGPEFVSAVCSRNVSERLSLKTVH
ncbi:PREDICTED: E3 ubiquitin-protein ligase RFWD2-like, partial [Amphimedon queenslandica]|uniref:Uncharacterized protein n=1 Tax=Amphimedon queenslandica TaxID=400682 RepID=A0AAN0JXC2_AMPQE